MLLKAGYGRRKMKVGSMQCRCGRCVVCAECRKDRCRNCDVRDLCGLKEDVITKIERGMLRWFGHLKKMNESRLIKQIYRANVCDGIRPYWWHIKKRPNFKHPKPTTWHEKIDECQ
ncbi:hypothetical protein EVAR_53912_1 [Eumeta japonica]|uniref:Uncharacterized protein n=1 Tax=Eumeta variegata TaxID=151549 RepID=A0A4C1YL86_EUMVA|nr:hypothetical protein EVAR_53912_1 [Eumeta japonica]